MLEIGKVQDKQAPILRGAEVVALLSASNWKEEAVLTRGDVSWNLRSRKNKRLIGALSTDPDISDTGEQARFLAEQTSWWRGTWDITLEGLRYTLSPKSIWRGTHRIERSGQEVAVSGTVGTWSPRVTLEATDSVPLDHQLFLLWMAFILNRRASSTATTGAIAGGAAAAAGSS
jgi:hypothetical protein